MKTVKLKPVNRKPAEVDLFVSQRYIDHNVCGVKLHLQTDFGCFEATGSSMRNPIDEENPEIAKTLAVARALSSLANGLQRRANGLMKHQDDLLKSRKPTQAPDIPKEVTKTKAIKKKAGW